MAKTGSCDILSEAEVHDVIENTLRRRNFRISRCEMSPAGDSPLGFLGEHHKIEAEVALSDGESEQLFYFVKSLPKSVPQHLEYALGTRAFYKEIQLYKTLFVDLRRAQRNPTKWCPEYYYSRGDEVLVVEDLSRQGYFMPEARTLLDEDHVKASLKVMAAMHAASFIFQDKFRRGVVETLSPNKSTSRDVTLDELYSHLTYETEVSDIKGHVGNHFMEVGFRSQVPVVDLMPNYTDLEKQKIKEKLPHVLRRILQLVKPSDKYANVFVHGDLWANNLLFRKGADARVKDAIIIDFQLARYAPPAHDVMMFLYLVQNTNFRREKQAEMFNYYYDCLSEELARNDMSADSTLPKGVFLESCRHYAELGLVSAVLYFQLIMAPSSVSGKFMASAELYHNVILVDRSEMIKECFRQDETYRNRMSEAMDELIREYILV